MRIVHFLFVRDYYTVLDWTVKSLIDLPLQGKGLTLGLAVSQGALAPACFCGFVIPFLGPVGFCPQIRRSYYLFFNYLFFNYL